MGEPTWLFYTVVQVNDQLPSEFDVKLIVMSCLGESKV